MDNNLQHCLNLLNENEKEIKLKAVKVLLDICDNIIKNPGEPKYRRIKVGNQVILEKLLPASGAIEHLFEIGFQEDGEYFHLPMTASLLKIQEIKKHLEELQTKILNPPVPKITGTKPKIIENKSNFLNQIENMFNDVLKYEDKNLQELTKNHIPITELQLKAMKRLRSLQMNIKNKNTTDNNESTNENKITIEDLVIIELLDWFKNEFFTWVNSLECSFCLTPCKYNRIEFSNDTRPIRIEIHKCDICGKEEKFPRYNDPKILLTTRKGRCGEWANAFTLICRSLGYDARLIHDETDHVWTEVWSVAENRWIHVDPCENVMDRPLLYEKGWKKKLTYVIAYSRDEIQDVTWRYTREQGAILKRRNKSTEERLSSFIYQLNEKRQSSTGYSVARKKFVNKRRLMELVEFLQLPPGMKKPEDNDNEYGGRISGDADWRIARGESSESHQPSVWKISKTMDKYSIRLDIVKDVYEALDESGKILEKRDSWKTGVYSSENIFRKIENDWKIVYLARNPGTKSGKIIWRIEIPDEKCLKVFKLSATTETFQNGNIKWTIIGKSKDHKKILGVENSKNFETKDLNNSKEIDIVAELSGGKGENAWQHAQLFRQSLSDPNNCSMLITLIFS